MRDPKRIPEILDQLKEIWEMFPDLRLTQIIMHVVLDDNHLYNMEDQALINRMKSFYNVDPGND